MLCVTGRREELPPHLMEDVGRYRYKVFVSYLGWPLHCPNDVEADEFDAPGAVYVFSQDKQGHVNGVARLLPTTAPYLLGKVFPSLWAGPDLPNSPDVWELSRFAAVDFDASASRNQASATHAVSLFRKVASVARERGARKLVTVSPVGMERLLRNNGFRSSRAGLPTQWNREYVIALIIDLFDEEANGRSKI
jgi:acyl homoserine lactone synthase